MWQSIHLERTKNKISCRKCNTTRDSISGGSVHLSEDIVINRFIPFYCFYRSTINDIRYPDDILHYYVQKFRRTVGLNFLLMGITPVLTRQFLQTINLKQKIFVKWTRPVLQYHRECFGLHWQTRCCSPSTTQHSAGIIKGAH
ncbi:hypothetical protein AVEN_48581-1 [Araneus ventricosus]|uniref:Uncharacterized protein n=1 Tax=Araneus ventricosus TaxID=182803 RepID=A0A4Y2HF33_ARAVE|nr:hypothetical protein AVEN_48581-1 [Araneus ventricosus]